MTRQEAFALVEEERTSQDRVWRADHRRPLRAGHPESRKNEEQYKFAAPHILLLEENASKLRSIWYGSKEEDDLQSRLVKIAAIAIRALEKIEPTRT